MSRSGDRYAVGRATIEDIAGNECEWESVKMATPAEQNVDRPVGALASEEQLSSGMVRRRSRRGRLAKWLVFLIILGGGGYYLMPIVSDRLQRGSKEDRPQGPSTHTVRRSRLILSVTEDGNVESAEQQRRELSH